MCVVSFLCPAEDLSSNGFRTVMEIDTLGTFNMCSAAFPHVSTLHTHLDLSALSFAAVLTGLVCR